MHAEINDNGGFRSCQVMYVWSNLLAGDGGKLSFKRKDCYNWLNGMHLKRIEGGDVNTLLALYEMKIKDKEFF